MSGPLDGIRVLELSSMVSGPMATLLLADQGADVIKVESPAGGDLTRHLGPRRGGMTAIFLSLNRNKRSLVLDLKDERGREILYRLLESCDVLVQNFRPGTIERMGFGEKRLREIRPDLVYCSISGFGEHGPYRDRRVYDPIIQALSGLASIQADRETGRPKMVRLIIPDKVTALTATQAITAALLARERTGRGQHVRLAMLDAMVSFLWPEGMTAFTLAGDGVENTRRGSTSDLVYQTADGFITVSTLSDVEWAGLARATGEVEWVTDPRFDTPTKRIENFGERLATVGRVLLTRTTGEWLEVLGREDVPCAPILRLEELLTDPQIEANELILELEHPQAGSVRQTRPAARFDGTPLGGLRPAPTLGQHSHELLAELGLGHSQIEDLREAGVLGRPTST